MASDPIQRSFMKSLQILNEMDNSLAPLVRDDIENGISSLMDHMSPNRDILRRVLYTRNPRLLSELLSRDTERFYVDLQKDPQKRVSLLSLFDSGRVDLLRILHQHGCPIIEQSNLLQQSILMNPNVEVFNLLLKEAGHLSLLFPNCTYKTILSVEGEAGAWMADFMDALPPHVKNNCIMEILVHFPRNDFHMKALAYALRATEAPLALPFQVTKKSISEKVQKLIEKTNSAHGRLELRSQEPDFRDLMSRPKDKTFFGLTDEDIKK